MEERKTRRRPNFFDILFLVLILLIFVPSLSLCLL